MNAAWQPPATPEAVLAAKDMTDEEKIELLRRWAYDAREESVAEEEGMPGGQDDRLHRVMKALEQIPGGIDAAQTSPTKQHGLPIKDED
jgi:hypothetical protein